MRLGERLHHRHRHRHRDCAYDAERDQEGDGDEIVVDAPRSHNNLETAHLREARERDAPQDGRTYQYQPAPGNVSHRRQPERADERADAHYRHQYPQTVRLHVQRLARPRRHQREVREPEQRRYQQQDHQPKAPGVLPRVLHAIYHVAEQVLSRCRGGLLAGVNHHRRDNREYVGRAHHEEHARGIYEQDEETGDGGAYDAR